MDETDEEKIWVSRCRNGDQAAFEALIRVHQQMIHALTFRMTGSLADCKDLAQEAFVRAYQQLDTYQGTAKFSSWLYRITVNVCLDWQRREKRRVQIYADWGESQTDTSTQADRAAWDSELSRKVQIALLKLPAKQRAAIVLTVYEDRSHAEAAQILGCSETTVSWRIFAARRKLKWLLSIQGDSNE
jgi:RNA polymerase sigma-70 factor (ECF subfamily)